MVNKAFISPKFMQKTNNTDFCCVYLDSKLAQGNFSQPFFSKVHAHFRYFFLKIFKAKRGVHYAPYAMVTMVI
jgi:hypothetical protein